MVNPHMQLILIQLLVDAVGGVILLTDSRELDKLIYKMLKITVLNKKARINTRINLYWIRKLQIWMSSRKKHMTITLIEITMKLLTSFNQVSIKARILNITSINHHKRKLLIHKKTMIIVKVINLMKNSYNKDNRLRIKYNMKNKKNSRIKLNRVQ